ncbi:hypothetical protein AUJ17_03535 [Candidatus Micrarchaeota archaeon CG1_02_47_40]|nr:MAG: hypothetical protein AUJ17_03535 [Candidatus Micrarchaeota archaeon CG1_02_47_40]
MAEEKSKNVEKKASVSEEKMEGKKNAAGRGEATGSVQGAGNLGFYLIVLAAVALIAVLLTLYFSGSENGDGTDALNGAQAKILLGSFDSLSGVKEYRMEYVEDVLGVPVQAHLVRGNATFSSKIKTDVSEREAYLDGDGNYYVCEAQKEVKKCARVENSSTLLDYAVSMNGKFFDGADIAKEKERDGFLISNGAIEFIGGVEKKEVDGIACSEIAYSVDLRKLTVGELAVLGLTPSDPAVVQFSEFVWTRCFAESGIAAKTGLSYKRGGVVYNYSQTMSVFESGVQDVAVPSGLVNEKEVEAMVAASEKVNAEFANCERTQTAEACYMEKAINNGEPVYCGRIKEAEKRDKCYIALVKIVKEPAKMCDAVALLKDDCYAELADATKDKTVCGKIVDEMIRQACNTALEPECETDVDCATGGCSGQLCLPKGEASGIITTCEFRQEYACYQNLGECGCNSGKCAWKESAVLDSCLANATGAGNPVILPVVNSS